MIKSIECFFKIYNYTTAKFMTIDGLANRFSDRDKSMGNRTEVDKVFLYFFQVTVEAMIHSSFK